VLAECHKREIPSPQHLIALRLWRYSHSKPRPNLAYWIQLRTHWILIFRCLTKPLPLFPSTTALNTTHALNEQLCVDTTYDESYFEGKVSPGKKSGSPFRPFRACSHFRPLPNPEGCRDRSRGSSE